MSLGIVIKGPEGIVLAAESRTTLVVQQPNAPAWQANFDNATKVFAFTDPNERTGAVTYGAAAIGQRSPHSFLPEFEAGLYKEGQAKSRLTVGGLAEEFARFFDGQWSTQDPLPPQAAGVTFVVAGFDEDEPYGSVYLIEIPKAVVPVEQQPGDFGITWGGQREVADRLIQGFDDRALEVLGKTLSLPSEQLNHLRDTLRSSLQMQIPLAAMGLQDCVDLALLFVKTTIECQRLALGLRGCGGPIDVAIITRNEGLRFVQRKQIHGELPTLT